MKPLRSYFDATASILPLRPFYIVGCDIPQFSAYAKVRRTGQRKEIIREINDEVMLNVTWHGAFLILTVHRDEKLLRESS